MTEYGRGRGPEPWHPEDPLYGDQGWTGHQTQQGQVPHGGAPQQQEYPQEPQYQQQQYPQHPQYQQYPEYQQQQYQQQYPQGQYPQQAQQAQQQQPQQYLQGQYPQQRYVGQQQAQQPQQPAYDSQGWDTGQGQYAAAVQSGPYAGVDPYTQQPAAGYPGEAPDLYSTEDAYAPPQPPGRRHPEPEPVEEPEPAEEPEKDLLTAGGGRDGDDGDGDDDGGDGRRGGRSKGGKPKKRSGTACLVAAVVILGVVGGGGYYGYDYLKARFSSAEDFAGEGSGEIVEVEIPKGSGLMQMGLILKKAGVVASGQAFVDAASKLPPGKAIQAGVYPLRKKMSASSAVEVMSDPRS